MLKIWELNIAHRRDYPKNYEFFYRGFALSIPLEPDVRSVWPLLSLGRFGLLSIRLADYIPQFEQGLAERLYALLKQNGIEVSSLSELSAEIVTMPRMFGYVFNPVSFYLCKCGSNPIAFIAEVRNTFGNLHHYVMKAPQHPLPWSLKFAKQMYVSPFYDVSGEYTIVLERFGEDLDVTVELRRGTEPAFSARLWGEGKLATRTSILKVLLRTPFYVLLVMFRIHLHAFFVFLRRAGKLVATPATTSSSTVILPGSIWYRLRSSLVALLLRR